MKGQLCPWLSSELKGLTSERDKPMSHVERKDIVVYKLLRNHCNNKTHAAKNHKELRILYI